MAKTITLTHDYPYPSVDVWDVVTDLDHLQTVVSGLLKFRSLPSGKIFEGQEMQVDVSLFGKLPYQPYSMTVVALDAEQHVFQSSEVGAGVKSWQHRLQIVETDDGCRIEESIEIDAGMMTPIFAAWARFMYQRRHHPRLRILEELSVRRA